MPAHMIWLVALAACPWPVGPRWTTVLPIASSTGRARSKACGSPPHMMASVPFFAPSTPPLTGQSRNATPASPSDASASRAVPAETVEQSITMAPGRRAGLIRSTSSSTSRSAETHITTTSHPAASAAGSSKAGAPVMVVSSAARAGVRFQAPESSPAPARLTAMGSPMAPSPMNPVFMPNTPRRPRRYCARKQPAGVAPAGPRPVVGRPPLAAELVHLLLGLDARLR